MSDAALGLDLIEIFSGRFAREAGFEAILAPSAVWAGHNLNIFLDNVAAPSELVLVNHAELPASCA